MIAITLLFIRFQAYLTAALNEIECALVLQMACTHSAAMAVLSRLGGAAGDRTVAAMASAAARLLRAYATQIEALRRLRHGGSWHRRRPGPTFW